MNRKLRNGMMAVALASTVVLGACQDNTATTTLNPGNQLAPITLDQLNKATSALKMLPATDAGWASGIVLEENPHEYWWRLLTTNGVDILVSGSHCWPWRTVALVAPGDGITWSKKGNDNKVCDGEVKLTVLGATEKVPA